MPMISLLRVVQNRYLSVPNVSGPAVIVTGGQSVMVMRVIYGIRKSPRHC
jgi:hypothetical protein